MVKIILLFFQLVLVSLVSNIIQFTFVRSISIRSFIKINADTVGFHITHVLTKSRNHDFSDANHVVYKALAIKCFFRPELQITALVCVTEVLRILKRKKTFVDDNVDKRKIDMKI